MAYIIAQGNSFALFSDVKRAIQHSSSIMYNLPKCTAPGIKNQGNVTIPHTDITIAQNLKMNKGYMYLVNSCMDNVWTKAMIFGNPKGKLLTYKNSQNEYHQIFLSEVAVAKIDICFLFNNLMCVKEVLRNEDFNLTQTYPMSDEMLDIIERLTTKE